LSCFSKRFFGPFPKGLNLRWAKKEGRTLLPLETKGGVKLGLGAPYNFFWA